MSTWLWLVVALVILTVVCALLAVVLWRRQTESSRRLVKRLTRLPLRSKLALAVALVRDERVPVGVRMLPPLLVLYLALPIDIIPDFIPVAGQLDDIVILVVGIGLLLRFVPPAVIEEHLARLEAPSVR